MWKLKVKHKLLVIWLGSIILTLSVMAGLFEYQIAGLHQQDSRATVTNAMTMLHHDMELAANRIQQSTYTLSARTDLVASMNMIDHGLKEAFEVEKRKISEELMRHATRTGDDFLALYDAKNQLVAFYVSAAAGGQGAGYVSLQNAKPVLVDSRSRLILNQTNADAITAMLNMLCQLGIRRSNQTSISRHADQKLVLSATSPIFEKRTSSHMKTIGKLLIGRLLREDFDLGISRTTHVDFQITSADQTDPLSTFTSKNQHTIWQDVPELELDGTPDHAHGTALKWVSSESHFLGIMSMLDQDGKTLFFIFSQRKDALQSTLQAFHKTVIAVFIITGLSIVPIGLYFFNRTITRPVDNLLKCTDNLRRGRHEAMEGFDSTDEFSELARSFQVMSTAVQAREEALTQSQKSLKTAQRIARIGNWEWNLEINEVEYSDEIYKILIRDPQQLGQHIEALLDCVHPDDVRALRRRISDCANNGDDFQMEHRILLPNGEERYIAHHGEAHKIGHQVVRINATLQDISERHQLELAKHELISTVSHELRTPLTSITGAIGLAVGGALGKLPPALNEMLNIADKNAKRLGQLIDDLLDIEKVANGSMNFELHPIAISDLLHNAEKDNQAYADTDNITLRVENDIPDAFIFADPERMAQVMANLLSNATKFSPQGDTVLIRARQDENEIIISIHDNGPGIPESFRPIVFERFTQADQSATRKNQKGGTGLGLAITKSIIELHDGSIGFDTRTAPDTPPGTTFTFKLPRWIKKQDQLSINP